MSSIQTNLAANQANLNLATTSMGLNKSIAALSSGFRINRSGDDAAGLAIANKLRAESRSLQVASRNASQASSMLQIADGAVGTISSIMDRLKELASQANSDNIGSQRPKLDAEFQSLISEIGRIASTTQYQGSNMVDGTFGASVSGGTVLSAANVSSATSSGAAAGTYTITSPGAGTLKMSNAAGTLTQTITNVGGAQTLNFSAFGIKVSTGAAYVADAAVGTVVVSGSGGNFMVSSSGQYSTNDLVSLASINLTTGATGLNLTGLDLLSSANAQTALSRIDTAVDSVNTAIGAIGAAQSRIDFASANVATITQNTIAAESTIRDADMAATTTQFSKYQILQQAGTAMLAQANSSASSILKLLQ